MIKPCAWCEGFPCKNSLSVHCLSLKKPWPQHAARDLVALADRFGWTRQPSGLWYCPECVSSDPNDPLIVD